MIKSFNRKIVLYVFFFLGIMLISWSFVIIIQNYEKQKNSIIQSSVNHIKRTETNFRNKISLNNNFITTLLETVSAGSSIKKNLKLEKDSLSLPSLDKYLKRYNTIKIFSIYNTKGKKVYNHFKKEYGYNDTTNEIPQILQKSLNTHEIHDSIHFNKEENLTTQYISYPIFSDDSSLLGFFYIVHKNSCIQRFFNDFDYQKEFSLGIYDIKKKKYVLTIFNAGQHDSDSLLFKDLPVSIGFNPVVKEFDNCYKVFTKTKLSYLKNNYYLIKIITPVKEWKQLQDSFENLIFSIILMIFGITLLFIVIFYSQRKYTKYSKINKILEEKIKSENRFSDLFQNSFMPSCIIQNGKIVFINKAGMEFLETEDITEINKIKLIELIHPDDREELLTRIKTFTPEKDNFKRRQRKLITTKGNMRIVELSGYRTEFRGKAAIHVMLTDITERQEFIKKLMESELKYRSIFEKLNDAVLLIKDNFFVDCNDAAVEIYGFKTKKELLGTHPGKLSPELQPDGSISLIKADEMIQKAGNEGFNRFEWLHKKQDGSLFWLDVSLTAIVMDDKKYIYVIGRDITEVKKMYSELKDSKNYLYNIIKRLPIPIMVYSDNHEITFINNRFSETFKYEIDDIPNTEEWWKLTINDDRERNELRENWNKAAAGMKSDSDVVEQQWVIKNKDGKELTCLFYAIRIKEEILVVINDISEVITLNRELLIAKEKAQESNRLKSAFLANLSHELRTPMNGILGFSQLLAAGDLEEEERLNYVEIIQQSGNRLLNMINDIINISKIDANQIEIFTDKVPLLPILSEIVEFYKLMAHNKNIDFTFETANISENIIIDTDEGKLKQIFSNIIGNAVKYTVEGEVVISANVYDNYIEIKVSDTGYGIKPEHHKQIFDRFVRLEETSNKTDGTGLGLSISQAFAKRLGIKISVESEYGKGSVFTITIPLGIDDKSLKIEKEKEIKDSLDTIPDLTGKTIVIAEDDELNYMILKLHIESTNADIIRANNGQEAVEIVSNQHVDFIFMDIKMPVMDGMKAMRIIKTSHPELPIVAQTAFTFSEDKDKALAHGFDDYLSKPLSKKDVIDVLKRFFRT